MQNMHHQFLSYILYTGNTVHSYEYVEMLEGPDSVLQVQLTSLVLLCSWRPLAIHKAYNL